MTSAMAICPDEEIFAKRTVPGYRAEAVWLFKNYFDTRDQQERELCVFFLFSETLPSLELQSVLGSNVTQNSIAEKWKDNRSDDHINEP